MKAYIDGACNGSTVGHLRLGQVSAIPFLWCPVEEQRRIVASVDTRTAPLDEAIQRAKRECGLIRELRCVVTADIVTGKLDVRAAAAALPDEPDEPADDVPIEEDVPEDDLDATTEETDE